MTLRVLLAGQEAAGGQILRTLASSEHEVVAVLTQEPKAPGGPSSLAKLAESFGTEVLPARLVRDPAFASRVRGWSVDVLLNVHSLHIVADEVLAAPTVGSFNLHPGPLPEYAGLNTVGWAIYRDEPEYGVTVHWMVPSIDAGPIAFQERFPLPADATALTLSTDCTRRGVELLEKVLDCAAADPRSIPIEEQDLSRRTYYSRHSIPQGGRIEWSRPAEEIARFGRAFDYGPFTSPWGRPSTIIGGDRLLEMTGLATTGEWAGMPPGSTRRSQDGGLLVASADEWVRVRRLYADGTPLEPSDIMEAAAEGGRSEHA